VNVVPSGSQLPYLIVYEYRLTDKYLYIKFGILEKKDQLIINSFDGRFTDTSLSAVHTFTLKGKGLSNYLFLALVILIPLFILMTLVVVIRAKLTK